MPSSRKSERPKPKRIPSFGESVRIFSRTLSQVPSNIRKTVRRVVVGKTYTYNEPNDLLGFHKITDLMFLHPSDINPNILKNGTGELSKEQQKGIKLLFHIKEIAERHPPEEKEKTINDLKVDVIKELDPNSASNRKAKAVIKNLTKGLKGGNRRTHNRRTRRRM